MRKVKKENFDYTEEEIVNAIKTWTNYLGFTGDECKCRLTANVLVGPGWFCTCGHYNILPFEATQEIFKNPDLGPKKDVIMAAHRKARG